MTSKKLVYLRLKYAFTNDLVSWKKQDNKLILEFEKPINLELEQEIIGYIRAILKPPKTIPLQAATIKDM